MCKAIFNIKLFNESWWKVKKNLIKMCIFKLIQKKYYTNERNSILFD